MPHVLGGMLAQQLMRWLEFHIGVLVCAPCVGRYAGMTVNVSVEISHRCVGVCPICWEVCWHDS